jgi:hypothetical protein
LSPAKEMNVSNLTHQQEQLKQRIHLRQKIGTLVYELYGLSEEEIKIVEGG